MTVVKKKSKLICIIQKGLFIFKVINSTLIGFIFLKQSKKSEYSSTYLSVKGGSQEVAAIVANLNQPDFGETFIGWLKSINRYPRNPFYKAQFFLIHIHIYSLSFGR